jgi:hypothetical protein
MMGMPNKLIGGASDAGATILVVKIELDFGLRLLDFGKALDCLPFVEEVEDGVAALT